MWNDKIVISTQLDDKNKFIQNNNTEWLGFVADTVTTESEVRQLLTENPFLEEYDVLLFGDNVPEGECSLWDLLFSSDCVIYALIFRRSLLVHTGSFNTLLPGNDFYEMVLRLAEKGKVYSVPCTAEKKANFEPVTMAFILRRYLPQLKEQNLLDECFLRILQIAEMQNQSEQFNAALKEFLDTDDKYEAIASDTAPCLVIVADNICHGVVEEFGNKLADALVTLGQAVITTNNRYGNYQEQSATELVQQLYKAIIGFQSPAFTKSTFHKMKGEKYQFWFDNPIFSLAHFTTFPRQLHILCHDSDYARYIREHYVLENVTQFPLAADIGKIIRKEESYDLVFIGAYLSYVEPHYEDQLSCLFYRYMSSHPHSTVEQGIRAIWNDMDITYNETLFLETVAFLWGVCLDLMKNYRHKVVETILTAGIPMHVFGDSWKLYTGLGAENLIYHPEVCGDEALEIWSKAKIGLNIMNGHKHGMTERIANIMLCGACCLSDETSYLKENFRVGEEIVLFNPDKLEELPDKIRYLLEHNEERQRIASAGQLNAQNNHTWRKRAEELLELIQEEKRII